MNNNSAEWQHEFYLTHDKYRMQGQGTDCYKVVKGLTRILQLPTIAKLTTDNESVISDFRLNSGEYGLEPYDEYAIKVDDTYGASLYMWSSKNELSASEVAVKSGQKVFFKCRDCGQEFEASIVNVVRSVSNDCTGCYNCKMKKIGAISKPECFVVRLMLAFAGENGIANPFSDVRNILGENSLLGLDFVDHIQKLCGEYNGSAWHGNDVQAAKDRFKFEAARKAGYAMIRVLEPGLEVFDLKYDIVMPEGFYCGGGKYNAEIMEEVGRKVIHLLEEIYGRKASPEIWALNNFKEFEIWYDANKKELEANARKKGPKGKTAAKMAA